jgi:hypothetical protein
MHPSISSARTRDHREEAKKVKRACIEKPDEIAEAGMITETGMQKKGSGVRFVEK